jgi:hypothetical protein
MPGARPSHGSLARPRGFGQATRDFVLALVRRLKGQVARFDELVDLAPGNDGATATFSERIKATLERANAGLDSILREQGEASRS